MTDNLTPDTVKRLLSDSADRVNPALSAKLRAAREEALLRYDARQTAPEFAWAGITDRFFAPLQHSPLFRASAAVLFAAVLFSGYTWWQHQIEYEEIDAEFAILTDDLPFDAYYAAE
ncbi:MAG: DUF3619 family protein [Gallionellaceae bacterium]|jgi:hypothetical protein|nr:DUF3619 family protein [Gallionellaceae bacterium]